MKGIQLFDESVKQQIIKDYAVMIIPKIIDKYDISNDGFYIYGLMLRCLITVAFSNSF